MDEPRENRSQRIAGRIANALFTFAIGLERYTVELPWEADIRWPNRCARCHAPSPDTTFNARLARPSAFNIAFNFSPPRAQRTLICPSCEPCRRSVKNQRLRQRLIPFPTMAITLVGGLWLASQFAPATPVITPILRIAIMLFAFGLGIGLAIAIGDPIDIVTTKRTVRFEFRNRDFAEQFAAANGAGVIDPQPLGI